MFYGFENIKIYKVLTLNKAISRCIFYKEKGFYEYTVIQQVTADFYGGYCLVSISENKYQCFPGNKTKSYINSD